MTEPLAYMQRTRDWYLALGYGNPFEWAHNQNVPFSGLGRPVSKSRVALITTAALFQPDKGDQGPGAPYNAAAKFYRVYSDSTEGEPDLRVSHIGIDRKHTTAEDMNTWFPLKQLRRLAAEGRIGEVAPRFHGAPTNRSQKTSIEQDCVDILARVREDEADVAVIVAN